MIIKKVNKVDRIKGTAIKVHYTEIHTAVFTSVMWNSWELTGVLRMQSVGELG